MTSPPFPDFPASAPQFSRLIGSIFPQLFPQLPAEPPKNGFAQKFAQLREWGRRQDMKYAAALEGADVEAVTPLAPRPSSPTPRNVDAIQFIGTALRLQYTTENGLSAARISGGRR